MNSERTIGYWMAGLTLGFVAVASMLLFSTKPSDVLNEVSMLKADVAELKREVSRLADKLNGIHQ